MLKITNIALTCKIKTDEELKLENLPNAQLKGKKKRIFSGFIIRLDRVTLTVFKNGNIIINGYKGDVSELDELRNYIVSYFDSCLKNEFTIYDLKVTNIATVAYLNHSINLGKFQLNNRGISSYEPELFPNLIVKFGDSSVTAIISRTGSIVLTGSIFLSMLKIYYETLIQLINDSENRLMKNNG